MIENAEYYKMLKRMIKAGGKRTIIADEIDLREFYEVYKFFGSVLKDSIQGQIKEGKSWAEVASGLGMTRQGAHRRFSK